ncbi:hypothetical protein [Paenibacillus pabuli]|uniref:hypothetical protein n=1 Tax=Paenibacillus pabuli TaxID=1472 RepID=UPI000A9B2667|nr:hypothetical protein [Paenibacillus pabuli]MEC0124010.1 hypothetical protein [Paenibacillus pabuli]
MKKVLTILLYPFAWVLGAWGILSGNADSALFAKDIATDRGYDGRELYDRIEHRNA